MHRIKFAVKFPDDIKINKIIKYQRLYSNIYDQTFKVFLFPTY